MTAVVVVGLGRMGSRYDAVPNPVPQSHIGAVLGTVGLSLAAAVDPDPEARRLAATQWGDRLAGKLCADLPEAATQAVIVLCGPTACRKEHVVAALAHAPRLLLLEKPLAGSLAEAAAIVTLLRNAGVPARVNFHRRFDPGFRSLRAAFHGRPLGATFRYGKGLFNYGSHAVDLMTEWLGVPVEVQGLGRPTSSPIGAEDPNLSFRCRSRDGAEALFLAVSGCPYDLFEGEVLFEDGMAWFSGGGGERRVFRPQAGVHYKGYAHLCEESRETGQVAGLPGLYAAIRDHVSSGAPLPGCTPEHALAGMNVLDAALRSSATGGQSMMMEEFA